MPDLNHPWRIGNSAGGVAEEGLLLLGAHQAEEFTGLGVVVAVVLTEIPVVGIPFQLQRRLGKVRLLLPFAVTVRFIPEGAAIVAVHPHQAVAVVAVIRATGGVDGNRKVVDAEPVTLGVAIGEEAPLEHLVGREADAGNDMGRIEGRLLDLGKVVLRVLVQLEDPHLDEGIIPVIPDLGQIEGMIGTGVRIGLRHDLHVEGPTGEIALLDALIEVPLVGLPALADGGLGLGIRQVLDPLLGLEVELDPEALVFGVDEAEGVAAETVHMTIGCGNAPVAHDDGHLVERLRQGRPEVPVVEGAAQVCAGVPLDGMIEIREFQGIAEEENRRIVSHEIPVALLSVELHGEAPDIPLGIRSPSLAGNGGKAKEALRFLSDLRENLRSGVLGDVMGNSEDAVSAGPLGVHPAFGDHLTVEVGQLLQKPDVLQELRPPRPGSPDILVVNNGGAGPGC
ncbi:MAG: hypothetical protein A4E72_00541 [Syntrophus sp. PtaU1.Bin208]|nr:MAG: hypothetical protein A4E72_00541 [Syntrophus sp. PtaU1.Bin208]